ncbi:MAG: hypothetical protein KGK08_04605 [Acidobacteriota bacterium]|nr:hypothetical protein [Acidobacteriota bacterium]
MSQGGWAAGAARRAADALLWKAGGRSVVLRLAAPGMAADATEQLGLAVPGYQDVVVEPAVFRRARARVTPEKVTRWEMLLSASGVEMALAPTGFVAASAIFAQAYGVLVDGTLLAVESVTESEVGGLPYVYRLLVRQPLAERV